MGVVIQRPGDPGHPGGNRRRIYVRVNYRGCRKTRVFNSTKAAENYAATLEALLKLGKVEDVFAPPAQLPEAPPTVTFAQAADRRLAVDGARLKGGTLDTYRNVLQRHLLPAFGERALVAITVPDVEGWWAGVRSRGLSRTHLGHIRGVFAGIFKRAMASGLLDRSPVNAIAGRLGREDREVRQVEWLREAELRALVAQAEALEPRHYPLLLTLPTTGLRYGEAQGLQVLDVDVAGCRLSVRRAIRKGRVSRPKNGKARSVDVAPSTMKVLAGWMDVIRAEAAVRGQEPLWLFPSSTGEPLDALQRGVPLLTVSRQLGHSSIAVTADVYGHLAPDAGREAAAAWEAILTRNPRATAAAEPA